MSEISPELLQLFQVDCFIQVACPRLSIDWGESYTKPLLTSWEAFEIWGNEEKIVEDPDNLQSTFPMDYYSNNGGEWTNYGVKRGYGGTVKQKFFKNPR